MLTCNLATTGCWRALCLAGWSALALCTEIASWWPRRAPADGLFDGLGRKSFSAACSRNILLWDSTFQFLQGDLTVFACSYFLPVTLLFHAGSLQPTAHAARASTSFPFSGVLECSPGRSSPGLTLCICVAAWFLTMCFHTPFITQPEKISANCASSPHEALGETKKK